MTRREALRGLFRPAAPALYRVLPTAVAPVVSAGSSPGASEEDAACAEAPATVAVIQGRKCLAYRNLSCSSCAERCPEPGAIVRERGIPRVDPTLCTGCRICHDVCPAPQNAILILPKKPPGGPAFGARRPNEL